jgi:hypothetical protein
VLDLEPNAELRIALISRRGPLSPAAMAFLDGAPTEPRKGHLIRPPYKAHRERVLDALPGPLLQSAV